ncbi:hypothetical protein DB347_13570 [Opitutaceae bacterium EW11]|nr:hypothetical protein DB347_13570 [Opitutaceae bacterium EW11]
MGARFSTISLPGRPRPRRVSAPSPVDKKREWDRRSAHWARVAVVGLVVAALSACVSPPPPASSGRPKAVKPPFSYEALGVRNSCFVESVHFYDRYLQKEKGAPGPVWTRILQWGNQEGDFKISSGHAVTVFARGSDLFYYDINFGVLPLTIPVDRRGDITEVGPAVFAQYPKFRPIFARYRDDFPQQAPKKPVDFLFYHPNGDVRDATRVANELGRFRPVRVIEFEMTENGRVRTSAAAVFVFGARVCLYFPTHGTHVSRPHDGSVDDLRYIGAVVRRLFPTAKDVRWQPGGYLLFPPKEK